MSKTLLFLLFVILNACSTDSCDKDSCDKERFIHKFYDQKEIKIDTINYRQLLIIDGANLVFEYNHIGEQCDETYDDEWGEKIVFEINETISSLDILDAELSEHNCIYHEYGAWVNRITKIKTGHIIGNKLNNNEWQITAQFSINLRNDSIRKIEFNEVYKL